MATATTRDVNITVFGANDDNGSRSAFSFVYVQGSMQKIDPTNEESFIKRIDLDGESLVLAIHDIPGKALAGLRDLAMKEANSAIITYSITSKEAFTYTSEIARQLERVKDRPIQSIPCVLVGLEAEKEDKRQVTFEQGKTLAESFSCPFFETSARNYINVLEPFETAAKLYLSQLKDVQEKEEKARKKKSVLAFFGMGTRQKSSENGTTSANSTPIKTSGGLSPTSKSAPASPFPDLAASNNNNHHIDILDVLIASYESEIHHHNAEHILHTLELAHIQQIITNGESEESLLILSPEQTLSNSIELTNTQNHILSQIEKLHKRQEELQQRLNAVGERERNEREEKVREREQLEAKLHMIDTQEKDLMILRDIRVAKYAAQTRFKPNPNLWVFYRALNIKLEEILLGCKAVAAGYVEADTTGAMGRIGKAVTLLGKVFSLAGEGAESTNIIINVAKLGSLGELQKLAEYLARRTTERYTEQILFLPLRSKAKKMGSKIVKPEKTISHLLAEFASAKFLASLQTHRFDNQTIDTVTAQLLALVSHPSIQSKSGTDKVISKHGLETFINAKEECWCYGDFFTKPGRVLNGTKYTSSALLPELYGYCLTTEQEVRHLSLAPDSTAGDKNTGSASPAHNKKVQDIAAHQEKISERQEYYAEMTRRTKEQNDQNSKRLEQLELTLQKLLERKDH